ncbi:MAG: type II toxin-antitoxin system RelE/ParE family toxin [Terriglobales bacterium]
MSSGYALHPEAFTGLDEIRDFIAQRNPDAADRIMAEIFGTIRGLVPFPPPVVTAAPTSVRGLCGSLWSMNT